MTDPREVEAECTALIRYLAGHPPSAYLIDCYRRALPLAQSPEPSPVDGWLLRAARLGRWPAQRGGCQRLSILSVNRLAGRALPATLTAPR